jgi:tripartite-type tricarboxylate transporter receptor subunit TctC
MYTSRQIILLAATTVGAAACTFASPAVAQERYPVKPIRLIVPFAAGGGNDTVARIVGEAISPSLGQPVIVENRPGAGGNLGTDMVVNSAADGYTVLHGTNGLAMNPYLYKRLPFDAQRDLRPVAMLAWTPLLILANPSSNISSFADLVSKAREKNNKLAYATPGNGTPHHFAMELLASHIGGNIAHVAYKGANPALTDVVGGQVPLLVSTPQSVSDFVKSGRLKVIAVMEAKRLPEYKDAPTVAETIPGFKVTIWHGLFVPAKTPEDVVGRLSNTVSRALNEPEVVKKMSAIGFTANFASGTTVQQLLATELTSWKAVAERAKIVPE